MDEPRGPQRAYDQELTTDDVLSTSVERVRSSRELIDELDQRLARGEQLLRADDD
jgi:hypothetical protein